MSNSPAVCGNGALAKYISDRSIYPVKLHVGCGGQRWNDFINVDLYPHDPLQPDSSRSGCAADVFADMRQLGLEAWTVHEIFTSHTLEHFTRWEALDMLRDWHRILVPNGKLVIETPDFWRCILWLFHPSKRRRCLGRNMFYGNQWDRLEFETHRYVWSANELRRELLRLGFRPVSITHHTATHQRGRDMRLVSIKPGEIREDCSE